MVKAIILSLFICLCCSGSFNCYAAFPMSALGGQLQVATASPPSKTDENPASEKRGRLLGIMSLAFGILALLIMSAYGDAWVIPLCFCLVIPGVFFGLLGEKEENKLAKIARIVNLVLLGLLLFGLSMDSWYHVF